MQSLQEQVYTPNSIPIPQFPPKEEESNAEKLIKIGMNRESQR